MTYSIPKIQPLVIGPMTGIEAFGPPPVQFGTVQMVGCSPNVSSTIGFDGNLLVELLWRLDL